jgi:hypothetical protein
MWRSLLGLSLLISLNPVLLGFILLVISRPRPVQNLFVYWVGALAVNLPVFVVPLVLIHVTPGFATFTQGWAMPAAASSGTVQPVQLGMAVVLLCIAAVMMARPRLREHANLRTGGGDTSTMVLESDRPTATSPPLRRAKDMAINAISGIRRLYGRLTASWEIGSLWVALVFGMMYLPSATLVLLIDTTIVASGAGIGEQVIAAIAFVVGFVAVLEIVLFSCLVAPARTEVVLRPVHEWARAHNRHILIVFFALIGSGSSQGAWASSEALLWSEPGCPIRNTCPTESGAGVAMLR